MVRVAGVSGFVGDWNGTLRSIGIITGTRDRGLVTEGTATTGLEDGSWKFPGY
jgi:hypothetical protein